MNWKDVSNFVDSLFVQLHENWFCILIYQTELSYYINDESFYFHGKTNDLFDMKAKIVPFLWENDQFRLWLLVRLWW